jgi:hypothetical protein
MKTASGQDVEFKVPEPVDVAVPNEKEQEPSKTKAKSPSKTPGAASTPVKPTVSSKPAKVTEAPKKKPAMKIFAAPGTTPTPNRSSSASD